MQLAVLPAGLPISLDGPLRLVTRQAAAGTCVRRGYSWELRDRRSVVVAGVSPSSSGGTIGLQGHKTVGYSFKVRDRRPVVAAVSPSLGEVSMRLQGHGREAAVQPGWGCRSMADEGPGTSSRSTGVCRGRGQRGSQGEEPLSLSRAAFQGLRGARVERRSRWTATNRDSGVEVGSQGGRGVAERETSGGGGVRKQGAEGKGEGEAETGAARQRLFDNIAPMYDQLNDLLSLGQHRVWKLAAIKWSRAQPGQTVLDVCCGSGDLALLLAARVGLEGKVFGLDFAAEQLAIAAKKQAADFRASKADISWLQGDAMELPFDDSSFDAATMGYGLRNVTDKRRAMAELLRVLRPGATVAVLDFNNSEDTTTRFVQGWMLDNVVVPVARQLQLEDEYTYLRPSIEQFPTGKEQVKLARSVGFANAVHYEIGGGLMGVLVATK